MMLQLKDIKFNYPRGRVGVSIQNLCFRPSLVTVILGENGSGKTTLLNIIGGHLTPSEGQIYLLGNDITHTKAEKRPTATVFQQIGLFPHLTVLENIKIAIEPNRLFGKSDATKQKAQQVLSEFNLGQFSGRKPSELSVGQQQRVAIARAVSSSPQVLLLDEPTSALDFTNIRALKTTLYEIKSKNIVPFIIIVSHDLPFVLSVADEIKFLKNGKLVFEGATQDFKESEWYIQSNYYSHEIS